jgi:hypothetical protein
MPESLPNPAPSSGQGSSPGAPLVDPNALVATFVSVLKTPADYFKSIKEEKGFQKCLVFSVAALLVYGVLAAIGFLFRGFGVGAAIVLLVQSAISGVIGPFIGGAVIWVICMIFGSKAPYEHSVRISAYGSAVAPVAGVCMLVPYIGWLGALVCWIYGIYVVVMGAKALNFEPKPPAAAPPA